MENKGFFYLFKIDRLNTHKLMFISCGLSGSKHAFISKKLLIVDIYFFSMHISLLVLLYLKVCSCKLLSALPLNDNLL